MRYKFAFSALIVLAFFPLAMACQDHRTNCKITQVQINSTGNSLVTFTNRTGDNPDQCGNVTKLIIDHNDTGAENMLAGVLAAKATEATFSHVRTCGCKDEWGTVWPKLAWSRY